HSDTLRHFSYFVIAYQPFFYSYINDNPSLFYLLLKMFQTKFYFYNPYSKFLLHHGFQPFSWLPYTLPFNHYIYNYYTLLTIKTKKLTYILIINILLFSYLFTQN